MGNKPVRFLSAAELEYAATTNWYLERSEAAAAQFVEEVQHALEKIAAAPGRWPPAKYGTRRFLLHRFPFSVVYRELPDVIQIVAVAHCHRRPGYWKERE